MVTTPQTERPEESLIRRVQNGENELFYELVQPHERSVYRAAFSILANAADAEDVAQEAVLKAFTHLSGFRGESKFGTWLVQITINEARMRRRKDRRSLYDSLDEPIESEEGDYTPRDFADWREIPLEALERKELAEAIQRAFKEMKPIYREILVLRDMEQLSVTETAKLLGISETNVRTRLLRARLQLRDALAPGYDGVWTCGEPQYRQVRPW